MSVCDADVKRRTDGWSLGRRGPTPAQRRGGWGSEARASGNGVRVADLELQVFVGQRLNVETDGGNGRDNLQ